MAPVSGMQRRVSIAAASSLLVAGAILIVFQALLTETKLAGRTVIDAGKPVMPSPGPVDGDLEPCGA